MDKTWIAASYTDTKYRAIDCFLLNYSWMKSSSVQIIVFCFWFLKSFEQIQQSQSQLMIVFYRDMKSGSWHTETHPVVFSTIETFVHCRGSYTHPHPHPHPQPTSGRFATMMTCKCKTLLSNLMLRVRLGRAAVLPARKPSWWPRHTNDRRVYCYAGFIVASGLAIFVQDFPLSERQRKNMFFIQFFSRENRCILSFPKSAT